MNIYKTLMNNIGTKKIATTPNSMNDKVLE